MEDQDGGAHHDLSVSQLLALRKAFASSEAGGRMLYDYINEHPDEFDEHGIELLMTKIYPSELKDQIEARLAAK